MLQNQCKGMIFYPNNQKKRHKKHKSVTFFDLGWSQNAGIAMKRYMEKDMPHGSS